MAVQIVEEINERNGFSDDDTNHRYTRSWTVYTDDPNDGSLTVLQAAGIPNFGDFYVESDAFGNPTNIDPDSKCVELRSEPADREENFQKWTVTAEYVGLTDPTAVPAEVDFDPVEYQKALTQDLTVNNGDDPNKPTGKPIQNSAGDPYEHGSTFDRSRWRLVLIQNVLDTSWNPIEMEPFNDSLNLTPFLSGLYPPGYPPLTCKLKIGAKRVRQSDNKTFYWQRKAIIDINARDFYFDNSGNQQRVGWDAVLRDAGYHCKGVIGARAKILLDGGLTPSQPVPLDGAGNLLPKNGTPKVNVFRGYLVKDWSNLGLENW